MRKAKYLIILFLILTSIPAYSTILMRNTFEEYEGLTPQECGWYKSASDSGVVIIEREDTVKYQTQRHGKYSLHIYDPDDSSYASAYKTFTNTASEYMTEFYIWIYHTHAHIDSFPLCVLLYESAEENISYRTDIALVLDTLGMVPNHHPYVIRVQDANGFHTACYLDTSDIDTWHKIQIYRKPPEAPLPAKVVLYFDGDSIATYTPMNSGYVTNKISLGTTEADAESDGEVFYDDVSIADCTDFEKQIAQINQKEMLSFLVEADHYFSRIHPYQIYIRYHYFNPGDLYYVMSLSNLLNNSFNSLTNYERLSYFNELTDKLNQIKLGLLYGRLTEKEKKLVKQSLKFVDKTFNKNYNLLSQKVQ